MVFLCRLANIKPFQPIHATVSGMHAEQSEKLRKARGVTRIAVQMSTGIGQALISKYESGERIPPTDVLILLAEFYNVSIDCILCRTDNPNVNR